MTNTKQHNRVDPESLSDDQLADAATLYELTDQPTETLVDAERNGMLDGIGCDGDD